MRLLLRLIRIQCPVKSDSFIRQVEMVNLWRSRIGINRLHIQYCAKTYYCGVSVGHSVGEWRPWPPQRYNKVKQC